MIAIVNYDTGNICSVTNALKRVGCTDWVYTDDKDILMKADKVILPGVGEASTAMAKLAERGLDTFIPTLTQPVLGICVGTQLMCQSSEEGNVECMGIFRTKVKKFQPDVHPEGQLSSFHSPLPTLKVPHMGWNQITLLLSRVVCRHHRHYEVHQRLQWSLGTRQLLRHAVPPREEWCCGSADH